MPNMKNIINTHNKKIINPSKDIAKTCNCIRRHKCPLNGKCLTNNVLYKASISLNEENSKAKICYGVSETAFNHRYMNYKIHSITWNTKLIQNYQMNIGTKKTSNISWKILGTHKLYNQSSKRYLLCLNEKLVIALHKDDDMLNKRFKVTSKYRHSNKYMPASSGSKD